MRKDVKDYVQSCDMCLRTKSTTQAPLRHLQLLDPPTEPCQSVSMDLITLLPRTPRGDNGQLAVVNWLTKMMLIAPTRPKTSADQVAQLLYDHVYRCLGLPSDTICDRNPILMSRFWRTPVDKTNVKLRPSSAYHPQSDGQSDIMNKNI